MIHFKAQIWNLCRLLIIIQWTICPCKHTKNNRQISFSCMYGRVSVWHSVALFTDANHWGNGCPQLHFFAGKKWLFWAIFKSTRVLKADNLYLKFSIFSIEGLQLNHTKLGYEFHCARVPKHDTRFCSRCSLGGRITKIRTAIGSLNLWYFFCQENKELLPPFKLGSFFPFEIL